MELVSLEKVLREQYSSPALDEKISSRRVVFTALPPRSSYAPNRPSRSILAVIIALHLAAIGLLAIARLESPPTPSTERLTTFSISEPPPPSPPEAVPEEPVTPPASAPVVAPSPRIDLTRAAPVTAVTPEKASPVSVPAAHETAPVALAPPAPAAPITPPNFSAGQLNNPGPAYPYQSRKAREEGVVLLRVLVSTDGRAARLAIEDSSGFTRLDEAAIKAVSKWRFVPANQAGEPREAWVLVPVTFSLNR